MGLILTILGIVVLVSGGRGVRRGPLLWGIIAIVVGLFLVPGYFYGLCPSHRAPVEWGVVPSYGSEKPRPEPCPTCPCRPRSRRSRVPGVGFTNGRKTVQRVEPPVSLVASTQVLYAAITDYLQEVGGQAWL